VLLLGGALQGDTLELEDHWKDIKVQGAEEMSIPARTEHTSAYHVSKGSTLRWTFRVKENDIGFGVRMRVQEWGGSREEEVLPTDRYDYQDTISGSWVADQDRTMILAFDNKYSRLRAKTVAHIVGTEKPPIFSEPVQEAQAPAVPIAAPTEPATTAEPPAAAAPEIVKEPAQVVTGALTVAEQQPPPAGVPAAAMPPSTAEAKPEMAAAAAAKPKAIV